MEAIQAVPNEHPQPRRSMRREALTEINEDTQPRTPQATSPDEMVIIQRGPRKKPLTWSPYEYNRSQVLGPPRQLVTDTPIPRGPELNPKLKRRLIMSPEKKQREMGELISKRLRSLCRFADK